MRAADGGQSAAAAPFLSRQGRSRSGVTDAGSHDCSKPSFVEAAPFQSLVAGAIAANITVLALETDLPDLKVWWFCDFVFLGFFAWEMALRVSRFGWTELVSESRRSGTILDCITAVAGLLELGWQWFSFASSQEDYHNSLSFRILRLVRLLRLLKFLKMAKRVAALGSALTTIMDSFSVIFGILFAFILCCAIPCTQLLSHKSYDDLDAGGSLRDVKDSFRDIPTATFALFQVTTLDNWMDIAGPAIEGDWRWQIFFVIFISFASWTMISILTAVASDSMVAAASDRQQIEARQREQLREEFLCFLHDAFIQADADGNGVMDRAEFDELIKKESVLTYMSEQGVAGVTVADLEKAWETLDASAGRTGQLTIDEFVTGFLALSKGISTHDIANVDYGLRKASGAVSARIHRLTESVPDLISKNEEVVSTLKKQQLLMHDQLACMQIWRNWATRQEDPTTQTEALPKMESPGSPPMD